MANSNFTWVDINHQFATHSGHKASRGFYIAGGKQPMGDAYLLMRINGGFPGDAKFLINDHKLTTGAFSSPQGHWALWMVQIPSVALNPGDNMLEIINGTFGEFQVASVVIHWLS